MSVASVNNGSLQLSELIISNEKYSNATGYVASSSTFSSSTSGVSIASITVGVPESSTTLTSNGNDSLVVNGGTGPINCGALYCGNANFSGVETTATGLTFCRNISNGNNELDIVVINPSTSTILNIYTSNSEINGGSTPGPYTNPIVSITLTSVSIDGILECIGLQDSSGSTGTAGQVPIATGGGQWAWGTPA